MKNKLVAGLTVLVTICSGICCFEGAMFGDFSALSKIMSSIMLAMWFIAIVYFARAYNGSPIQTYLISILLASVLVVEIGVHFSEDSNSTIRVLFLAPMFVLCGFVDFMKQLTGFMELEIYICITAFFLVTNLVCCLRYSKISEKQG